MQLAPGRCHPLTVLDDHSRYALGLEACADERRDTVQQRLTAIFRRYGLPRKMLMDNGPPWGAEGQADYTSLDGVAAAPGSAGEPFPPLSSPDPG